MKNQLVTKAAILFISSISIVGCSTAQNSEGENKRGEKEHEKLSIDELFIKMDVNKDGYLDKDEVEGPLENDFNKIDTDKDKLISKEEMENAPKPRGGRPPKK